MHRQSLSLLALIIAALMLSACAGTARTHDKIVDDAEQISVVERSARMSGIQVTWVNPPKKRVSAGH